MQLSKKSLSIEVFDRPDIVNRIVTALFSKGFNLDDLTYCILDTDTGRALCRVSVVDNGAPNLADTLEQVRLRLAKDFEPQTPYDRWFRLPQARFTFVTGDRIGLVRDFVRHTVQSLDRNRNQCGGNILELKGFAISDEGLYAIQALVATTSLFQQARLVAFFEDFCRTNEVLSYDVVFDNFLSDYCEEAESDAS